MRESSRQAEFYKSRNEPIAIMWANLGDIASECIETHRVLNLSLGPQKQFNPRILPVRA